MTEAVRLGRMLPSYENATRLAFFVSAKWKFALSILKALCHFLAF